MWKKFKYFLSTGDRIMSAIDDLRTAVTELNTSVSNEIAAIAAAIKAASSGSTDGSVSASDVESFVIQINTAKATLDAETAVLTATPVPPAV